MPSLCIKCYIYAGTKRLPANKEKSDKWLAVLGISRETIAVKKPLVCDGCYNLYGLANPYITPREVL
jgi:hypothetical protein